MLNFIKYVLVCGIEWGMNLIQKSLGEPIIKSEIVYNYYQKTYFNFNP